MIVRRAHLSLGFFSFLRGGGTGASPLVSFLTAFFTNFFLGVDCASDSDVTSETEDSICEAIVGFGLTPI